MSFFTDVITKDKRFGSTEKINDTGLLEPGTRTACLAILADAAKQGVELRVIETYRSQARQRMLWEENLTQLKIVGCHGYGVACDFALYENGTYVSDGSKYGALWALAKKYGMISGEDWGHNTPTTSFRDPDHVQRVPVWRQPQLFAGSWYPPEVYDPRADMQSLPKVPAMSMSTAQIALNKAGASLSVDNEMGPATIDAIKSFQHENNLLESGVLSPATIAALRKIA